MMGWKQGPGRPAVGRAVALAAVAVSGALLALWGSPAPAGIADSVVALTGGPSTSTSSTNATFTWKIKARGVAATRCRLDGGSDDRCTSPKTYTGLAIGPHRFLVRAYGASGAMIGSDAWSWQVVARPSTTTGSTSTEPTTTAQAPTTQATTTTGQPPPSVLALARAIVGTPGNDVLVGTPGPDVLLGLGGNDTIHG